MRSLGVEFEIIPANIDEQAVVAVDPIKRAQLIAQAKAEAVQRQFLEAIIVAADTYIILNDEILEKPGSLDEARQMLAKQSGEIATEVTGFCYLDPNRDLVVVKAVTAEIKFRQLTAAEIENYVTTQPVLTWSAAFCPAYDSGARLIKSINGSFTGFTHGLPLEELIPLLQQSKVI